MFLNARRAKAETIDRLYGAIVAQAREPVFYRALRVPDTLEGRFDLLVLHVYLLYRRLARAGDEMRLVGQGVFDRFLDDMDASLREIGVGDLAVPKRMRSIGEAFYGRAEVYDAALAAQGEAALSAAVHRNVYSSLAGAEAAAERLAAYMRRALVSLQATDAAAIVEAGPVFPVPETEAP